jgi:hypothetical protein
LRCGRKLTDYGFAAFCEIDEMGCERCAVPPAEQGPSV